MGAGFSSSSSSSSRAGAGEAAERGGGGGGRCGGGCLQPLLRRRRDRRQDGGVGASGGTPAQGVQRDQLLREPWVNPLAKVARCARTLRVGARIHLNSQRLRRVLKKIKDLDEDEEQERWADVHKRNAELVLDHIYRYQGFFTKMGQAVSSKKSDLPGPWVETLKPLQNEMPHSRFPAVRRTLQKGLGKRLPEVFADIEERPIASASVAQAHVAHLRAGGQKVCVKVQHPGVADLMSTDITTLEFLLMLMRKLHSDAPDLTEIAKEWRRSSGEEVDFRLEMKNALDAVRAIRRHGLNIGCCEPLPEYCSRKVLTMRFIEGWKITDTEKLPACTDREAMGNQLWEAFAMLTFEEGLIHGDPHPGNIFVERTPVGEGAEQQRGLGGGDATPQQQEGGVRPVFLDWGIVKRLTPEERLALAKWVVASLSRDRVLYSNALRELGFEFGKTPDYQQLDNFMKGGMLALRDTIPSSSMQQFSQQRSKVDASERDRAKADRKKEGSTGRPVIKIPGTILYFFRGVGLLQDCCGMLDVSVPVAKVMLKYALPLLSAEVARPAAPLGGSSARSEMESAVLTKLRELADEGAVLGAQVAVLRGDGQDASGNAWLSDVAFGQLGHTGGPMSERAMVPLLDVGVGVLVKCLLVALSRPIVTGKVVSLDSHVEHLWPEFTQRGKFGVSIRRLLQHQAGLGKPFSSKLSYKTFGSETKMEESIAGSPHEEHSGPCRVLGESISAMLRRATGHGSAAEALRSLMAPLGLEDDIAYHGAEERLAYLEHRLVKEVTMATMWEILEERQQNEEAQNEKKQEDADGKEKKKPAPWLAWEQVAQERPWCLDPLLMNKDDFRNGNACATGRGLRASAKALCRLYAADAVPAALLKDSCTKHARLRVGSLKEWEDLGQCLDVGAGWQLMRFRRLDGGGGDVVGFGHADGTTGSVALRVGDVSVAVLLTCVDADARHAGLELLRVVARHLGLEPAWPKEAPVVSAGAGAAGKLDAEPGAVPEKPGELSAALRRLEAQLERLSEAMRMQQQQDPGVGLPAACSTSDTSTAALTNSSCLTGRWASAEYVGLDDLLDFFEVPGTVRGFINKAKRKLEIEEDGDQIRIGMTTTVAGRRMEAADLSFTVGEEFQGEAQMGGAFKAVAKWVAADAGGGGGEQEMAEAGGPRALVIEKRLSPQGRSIVLEETYTITADGRLSLGTRVPGLGEVEVEVASVADRDVLCRSLDQRSLRLKKDAKLSSGTARRRGRLVSSSIADLGAMQVPGKVKLQYDDVRCTAYFDAEGGRPPPPMRSGGNGIVGAAGGAASRGSASAGSASAAPQRMASSILGGQVWKESNHLRVWRQRWLSLTAQELRCFKSDGTLTLAIPVRDVRRVYCADDLKRRPGCFCAETPRKKYFMAVGDPSEKRRWIEELLRASRAV